MSMTAPYSAKYSAVSATAPDTDLLARLRAGDEAAFETLFRRHYALVYGIVYRLAPDEADDLAQEVFLRLYRRPPRAGDSNLAAWLYRVAVNVGCHLTERTPPHAPYGGRARRTEEARLPAPRLATPRWRRAARRSAGARRATPHGRRRPRWCPTQRPAIARSPAS